MSFNKLENRNGESNSCFLASCHRWLFLYNGMIPYARVCRSWTVRDFQQQEKTPSYTLPTIAVGLTTSLTAAQETWNAHTNPFDTHTQKERVYHGCICTNKGRKEHKKRSVCMWAVCAYLKASPNIHSVSSSLCVCVSSSWPTQTSPTSAKTSGDSSSCAWGWIAK